MNTEIVGMLAGLLTTIAFVPQVWRIWKTRSTHDLSLTMYAVFTAGVVLWLVYGIMMGALPIIVTNVATLLLAGAVLVGKLRFG